jgi:hypothetical protein
MVIDNEVPSGHELIRCINTITKFTEMFNRRRLRMVKFPAQANIEHLNPMHYEPVTTLDEAVRYEMHGQVALWLLEMVHEELLSGDGMLRLLLPACLPELVFFTDYCLRVVMELRQHVHDRGGPPHTVQHRLQVVDQQELDLTVARQLFRALRDREADPIPDDDQQY